LGFRDKDRFFDGNLYVFESYGAKNLTKEILNKGWRLRGLNKLLKKLQETGTTARRSGSIKSIQNISCFSAL